MSAEAILDPLHPNSSDVSAADLGGNGHQGLASDVSAASALLNPSNERLIDFHLAAKRLTARADHRASEFVKPRPGGLVAPNAQYTIQTEGTGPVLLSDDPPHDLKPKAERLSSVLQNGPRRHRDFPATALAVQELTSREPSSIALASGAAEAVRPSQLNEVLPAGLVVSKAPCELAGGAWVVLHARNYYRLGQLESS